LGALERAARGDQHPEFVPNANEDEVNLEHVLPEAPGDKWKHLTAEQCRTLYKRIGNFALMRAKENSTIGNAAFSQKKVVFGKSTFKLTKGLAKLTEWNEKTIAERQRKLATIAVQTWSGKLT
jgi:hypothetical protein